MCMGRGYTLQGVIATAAAGMSSSAVTAPRFRVRMRAMTESDFAGTYASAEMTLDLRVEDGRLGGEIILHGKRLPLRAALYREHIYGSFGSLGTEFPFQAGFEGPHLRVPSRRAEYVLPVAAPGNPLAAMVPPAAAPPAPAPPAVEPQVVRHP